MKLSKSAIVGLACGLLCAACVGLYVAQVDEGLARARSEDLARYGGEQVEVCVARRDLAAGETVTESDIEMKSWVASLLPEGAVTDKSEAVGRQLASAVLSGEVVSARRFGSDDAALDVPEGFSAVSVPACGVQAVGGALRPGMRVDLYAVGSASTTQVLSGALVLESSAMDSGAGVVSSSNEAWVTLAVEPQKVQELVTAVSNLDLYFALPDETDRKNA